MSQYSAASASGRHGDRTDISTLAGQPDTTQGFGFAAVVWVFFVRLRVQGVGASNPTRDRTTRSSPAASRPVVATQRGRFVVRGATCGRRRPALRTKKPSPCPNPSTSDHSRLRQSHLGCRYRLILVSLDSQPPDLRRSRIHADGTARGEQVAAPERGRPPHAGRRDRGHEPAAQQGRHDGT